MPTFIRAGFADIASGRRMADGWRRVAATRARWLVPALICTVFLGIVYGSTLVTAYDYHDAYYHYLLDKTSPCRAHPQWLYMLLLGRPLYSLLSCQSLHALVWTPDDTYKIRLIAIAGLILCATFAARMMMRRGLPAPVAGLFASGLFAMPGLLVFVNMTSDAANIFAIGATTAAFALLERAGASRLRIAAAVALLLLAMLTYQQLVPFLFVLVAVAIILRPDPTESRALLISSIVAFTIAAVLFLMIHKLILIPYLESIAGEPIGKRWPESTVEMAIKFAPILAVTNFVANFPRVFAVWFMNLSDYLWLVTLCLFVLCGALFIAGGSNKRDRIERAIWAAILLGTANGLTLLTATPAAPHRHSVPFEALICALIALQLFVAPDRFIRLRRYAGASRAAAVAFVACGLGYSAWNLDRNLVRPNAEEFAYLVNALRSYDPAARPKVCFIRSRYADISGYRSSSIDIKREFGRTTSMFTADVEGYAAAAAKTLGINAQAIRAVENLDTDTVEAGCDLILDMRIFQQKFLDAHAGAW